MPSGVYQRTKPAWNKGRKNVYSSESLIRMSEGQKRVGNIPPSRKGIKTVDNVRKKISEKLRGIKREPFSIEHKIEREE